MRLSGAHIRTLSTRGEDPGDDGTLADLTSGLMWLVTACVGLAALALPGGARVHPHWVVALAGFAVAWGGVSLYLGVRAKTMSLGCRAVVTALMMPVVALSLWATGGVASYLQPILLFTALFLAYFFPPRLCWPLVALFTLAYSTPLLYDGTALHSAYPARVAMFATAVVGEAIAGRFLKGRLLWAERRQRQMAERDPLTGLHNRRAFDAALRSAARSDGRANAAVVLFDFNGFKLINDAHGHPVGDAVLCEIARASERAVRDGDCLARIGGDEFAVVAPGAGHDGAKRLVDSLDAAIRAAAMPDGVGPVQATFAWALAPDDGSDPHALVGRADERLIERKRAKLRSLPSANPATGMAGAGG